MTATISTPRLELRRMNQQFLALCLADDRTAAAQHLGCTIDDEWYEVADLMQIRADQIAADPTLVDWCLRGMVLRDEQRMVGYIGFHTKPGAAYLAPYSPGVEFGYTVFTTYRRRGYAREASLGVMRWAHETHGVTRFVASVSPENLPSRQLIAGLGFVQIGGHMDEEDGWEDIYEAVYCPAAGGGSDT